MIDLRTLQAFVTVAQEGNVTRASDVLNLTQPAVSLQLKRLSDETGLTLFNRTPSGLELTRDGAALVVKAEQVLSALLDFGQTARHLTGSIRGKLRIGTIIDPGFTRLGSFLGALVEEAPELETELMHGMSGDVPQRLLRGEIDVGYFLGEVEGQNRLLSAETLENEPLFASQELARFSYWVVGPPGWEARIIGRDWRALARLPWIGTPDASVHNRLLGRIFESHGVTQNQVALVDQEPSMLAMVRSGVGLCLCRDSIALAEKQAHGLVVNDVVEVPTNLSFITHAKRRQEPNIDCAFRVMKGLWS